MQYYQGHIIFMARHGDIIICSLIIARSIYASVVLPLRQAVALYFPSKA
jgi:hypothetical protein